MTDIERSGSIDLEKELTCSICTEILYQPLTLLDCLHTFCGSCLKEWFSWQASQASTSKSNPFTCPSCRASVRETRPNATVTTLLEMYLKANPGKGKTAQEKEAIAQGYKAGENVLPKIKRKKETAEELEDRRMVEEARELSLQEVGIRNNGYERGVRHRAREAAREAQAREGYRSGGPVDEAARAREIEHQTSLRSIVSRSDLGDSEDMEEEILRQIMEDGILEGIDLHNLDVSQEEELSEKIADAYRRRHRHHRRTRSRDTRSAHRRSVSHDHDPAAEQRRLRRQGGSSGGAVLSSNPEHPPVSRPHLLEAYPTGQSHRRRTSSENRAQTSPTPPSHSRRSFDTETQAARSATDLSSRDDRSGRSSSARSELADRPQRSDSPGRSQLSPRSPAQTHQHQSSKSPHGRSRPSPNTAATQLASMPTERSSNPGHHLHPVERLRNKSAENVNGSQSSAAPAQATSTANTEQPQTYPEPSVTCKRCGKSDLEHRLHWNCSRCEGGSYSICHRCYRTGKGCLHWYGFGHAAMQRYERQAPPNGYPPDHESPHRLQGHQYLQPPPDASRKTFPSQVTTSNPASRLQSGPFCSTCSTFSPSYYWQCSTCNDGEWGFCNPCVNQDRCCTHVLLPVAYHPPPANPTSPPHSPRSSTAQKAPVAHPAPPPPSGSLELGYHPLTISTNCDQCAYPIPPSTTRLHCPTCNDGNYDLCTSCYLKLIKRGVVASENGPKGWRRCPNGHRMMVVGFEDGSSGQRRVVVEGVVGGWALDESKIPALNPALSINSPRIDNGTVGEAPTAEWNWREGTERRRAKTVHRQSHSTSAPNSPDPNLSSSKINETIFPPSGGIGLKVLALWSYWPQDEVEDELGFPKGAEIRECENINEDWFWGIYCRRKGLFPGGYGRVVGRVGL